MLCFAFNQIVWLVTCVFGFLYQCSSSCASSTLCFLYFTQYAAPAGGCLLLLREESLHREQILLPIQASLNLCITFHSKSVHAVASCFFFTLRTKFCCLLWLHSVLRLIITLACASQQYVLVCWAVPLSSRMFVISLFVCV